MSTNTLGIAVYLPNCLFRIEYDKNFLSESINELDTLLDSHGVKKDICERISTVMQQVNITSRHLANGMIDQETGIAQISIGFVYAYTKQKHASIKKLLSLRGLIGCLAGDTLYLNPCKNEEIYEENVNFTQSAAFANDDDDDDMIDITPKKPTIH